MPKIVKTAQGKRCMSAKGKFLKNSKCGIGSKSRSSHTSSLLGGVVLCIKNKKGVGSCTAVRNQSKKHVLKNGSLIWADNDKSPSRVAAGKRLAGKSKIAKAAKKCSASLKTAKRNGGSFNYACCVSKAASKSGKGSPKACKVAGMSGVSSRRRRTAKRRPARRR